MNDSAKPLTGLVAAVTGGASGIGAAIVSELLARGAMVAALDINPQNVPKGAFGLTVDVSNDDSVRAGIDAIIVKWGRLDILVNNAGIGAQGTIESNPDEEWLKVFNVNVFGIKRVSSAALPHLRKSPSAAIVNIASVAAVVGIPQRALYSASKGAVQTLTLAMAADHLAEGVRVNGVNPGTAATEWVQRLLDSNPDPQAERVALNARQPHGRLVEADEIAKAVAYLVDPSSGSTVGLMMSIDGGMSPLRTRPKA